MHAQSMLGKYTVMHLFHIIDHCQDTPLRSVTIPRLELCAAHLLARVLSHVCELLKPREDCVYAWSDSSITLAWIKTPPQCLKPFVAIPSQMQLP